MKRSLVLLGTAAVLAFTLAFSAAAKPALKDNRQVTDGLIAVGMALEIDRMCDTISARKLRGFAFLNNLRQVARAQGYSDAEIEAFVDNATEKERLKARARAILAGKGAKDAESFCTVGRAEIASGSLAGDLLRAR